MAAEYDGLPNEVLPSHYSLSIRNLSFSEPWTYQGMVRIDVDVLSPTNSITLNTKDLTILGAEIASNLGSATGTISKVATVYHDVEKQRTTFTFEEVLSSSRGSSSVLSISFQGIIGDNMLGFYRSSYDLAADQRSESPNELRQQRFMFSTQFQPSEARRAFPCFDEPKFRTTFDLEIEIPAELTALSNMEVKETKDNFKGLKIVFFERSPPMSTYLLAWAVGEFEYIEHVAIRADLQDLQIRLYTTSGLTNFGSLGLEVAHKALSFFSEMFHIDYPLPKLDLLAVHAMADDAMENWGLLTFQTTALLYDERNSNPSNRVRVAYIIAHEIAHQWFGNLVTMYWWNDLWLNEGFATWAGWHAVDHIFPQWHIWSQFTAESMQTALQLDSMRASHPVEVPVPTGLEVDSIFDAISYTKGSSLIRMLVAYFGEDKFVRGVQAYLKTHAYSNAKASDLWTALSDACEYDLAQFMCTWVQEVGFPVVSVIEAPNGVVELRQHRFSSDSISSSGDEAPVWWIPVRTQALSGPKCEKAHKRLFCSQETSCAIDGADVAVLNSDQTGFFRTCWTTSQVHTLGENLLQLSSQEVIGLIGDVAAMATAGKGSTNTVTLLSLLQHCRSHTDCHVWSIMLSALGFVRRTFSRDEQIAAGLNKFLIELTEAALEDVGMQLGTADSDDHLTNVWRSLLLSSAGVAGHERLITEAQKKFEEYRRGAILAIPNSLKKVVLQVAVAGGGAVVCQAMMQLYSRIESIDGKETILDALGHVRTAHLAREVLDFAFSGAVETQNIPHLTESLANNSEIRVCEALWHFVTKEWGLVSRVLGATMVVFEPFLQSTLEPLTSQEAADDARSFFKHKDTTGYSRGLGVAIETIERNARYLERDRETVKEWLSIASYRNSS